MKLIDNNIHTVSLLYMRRIYNNYAAWLATYAMLNAMDMQLTMIGIMKYGAEIEANPFIRVMVGGQYLLSLFLVFMLFALFWSMKLLWNLKEPQCRYSRAFGWLLIIAYAGVNLRSLAFFAGLISI